MCAPLALACTHEPLPLRNTVSPIFPDYLKSKSFYLSERMELSNKPLSFSATSASFSRSSRGIVLSFALWPSHRWLGHAENVRTRRPIAFLPIIFDLLFFEASTLEKP